MDLHEDAEKNVVTAVFELPGIRKEDVSLDVHNGRLTVSAESKISEDHQEGGYAIRERRFGKYSRTLQLPQGVKVRILSPHRRTMLIIHRTKKSKHRWRMAF